LLAAATPLPLAFLPPLVACFLGLLEVLQYIKSRKHQAAGLAQTGEKDDKAVLQMPSISGLTGDLAEHSKAGQLLGSGGSSNSSVAAASRGNGRVCA